MHPSLEALTPAEARRLVESQSLLADWLDTNRIPFDLRSFGFLSARAAEAYEAAAPPPLPSPHRLDAAQLRDFVSRAVRLPLRVRQVAQLCLEDGLTLDVCAKRLGISRETVRVHLRRLRQLRRCAERNG